MTPSSCAASRAPCDLPRDRQRLVERNWSARDTLREILAFDEFENKCRDAVRFFDAVDVRDVGVIQGREHLRFPSEIARCDRDRRRRSAAAP